MKKVKMFEEFLNEDTSINSTLKKLQKKIVNNIKKNTPADSEKKDILQWIKDDASMHTQQLRRSNKRSTDWKADEDVYNKVYTEFAEITYNKYFK
jgi:hypothetical protein|tara:strand:+ start:46 stop:330 length:285 start_codon:yes stop_codon:yes gene_type:complete